MGLICYVPGCLEPVNARGLCKKHYARWQRHGDPLGGKDWRGSPSRRFWAKVNKDGPVSTRRPDLGPCWVWTAHLSRKGYGAFKVGGKVVGAHSWAYCDAHGPLPDGLEPDHTCGNRACVKAIPDEYGPSHLEAVTHAENMRRARKTHCVNGHEFTAENTYERPGGGRTCRECQSKYART